MMKKALIAAVLTTTLILTGCGGSSPKKEAQEALKKNISLTWLTSSVKNDTTGKWRVAECLTDQQPSEWAKQYYDGYFESDDEVHAVVNFTLNTTNAVRVEGDQIVIDVHDYVQGEEHDANLLFTGELLDTQMVKR
jgi:uncharacterized lipoprotein NlpE involved in copper resistance